MTIFRLIALLLAIGIGYYLLRCVHNRKLNGFEFLMWFGLILSIVVLSIFPTILNIVFQYLTLSMNNRYDRLIGLAFIFLFITLALIFYYRNKLQLFREQFLTFVQTATVATFIKKYGDKKGSYPLFILIPAFNEEANIEKVLQRIPETICGLTPKTVVISDGSTDNTAQVALKNGAWVAEHTLNYGQGMTLETGYQCAIAMQAIYAVTLDADGQYKPEDIEKVMTPIIQDQADIVSGSRILGYYEQKYAPNQLIRSVGVRFFNIILTILTGKKITDSSSGFRAVKVNALHGMRFVQEQFHSSEFLIECLKKKLRFKEVPVSFLRRASGKSKKPPSLRYGFGFLRAVLYTWLRN